MIMVAGLVAVLVLIAYAAAHGFICNVRRARAAWRAAPFDGVPLGNAAVVPVPTPRRWPAAHEIDAPAAAAAYASLAVERALMRSITGELLIVIGGAVLGTGLPHVLRFWAQGTAVLLVVVVLVVVALVGSGGILRLRATRVWDPLARRYQRRYAELTRPAVPEPEPERPRGLLTWLWRRSA